MPPQGNSTISIVIHIILDEGGWGSSVYSIDFAFILGGERVISLGREAGVQKYTVHNSKIDFPVFYRRKLSCLVRCLYTGTVFD